MQTTLSFHMGTNYNVYHNDRTIEVNANHSYEKEHNWYDESNTTLQNAFDELFTDSFKEFNDRQREDRKFEGTYLEKLQAAEEREKEKLKEARLRGEPTSHLRQCKKAVKTSYELIIGFGNVRDHPEFAMGGSMQDSAKAILIDYISKLKERYSDNIKVYHSSIHTGENGNIHAHIDLIFYSGNCTRGMKKQVSLNKALADLGYTGETIFNEKGKKIRVNPITQWENDQREIIKELSLNSGIEIVDGKASRPHIDTELYKAEADIKYINELASEMNQRQDDMLRFVAANDKVAEYIEHVENQEFRKMANRQKEVLAASWSEFNKATSEYFSIYRNQKQQLFDELQQVRHDAKRSKNKLNKLLYDITNGNEFFIIKMFKLVMAIFVVLEVESLESEVQRLQSINNELKKLSKKVMSESQLVSNELRNKNIDKLESALDEYEQSLNDSIQKIYNVVPFVEIQIDER